MHFSLHKDNRPYQNTNGPYQNTNLVGIMIIGILTVGILIPTRKMHIVERANTMSAERHFWTSFSFRGHLKSTLIFKISF